MRDKHDDDNNYNVDITKFIWLIRYTVKLIHVSLRHHLYASLYCNFFRFFIFISHCGFTLEVNICYYGSVFVWWRWSILFVNTLNYVSGTTAFNRISTSMSLFTVSRAWCNQLNKCTVLFLLHLCEDIFYSIASMLFIYRCNYCCA